MEYIITDSEVEALILESHLIKKHKPKYNILLKDDKKYPYFLITDEDFPRIQVVRKKNLNPDKGRFYGPYTDVGAMYATLDFLKRLFPLKQCKTPKFSNRPCLYYHIGKCLAPCQGKVTPEEYQRLINQVELFLSGKQTELLNQIKLQMQKYAEAEQFEKAAKMRDSYNDLLKTLERQKVVYENTKLNDDILNDIKIDKIATNIINDLEIYCNNLGCPWKGKLIDFPTHIKQCYFNPNEVPEYIKEVLTSKNKDKSVFNSNENSYNKADEENEDSHDNNLTSFNTKSSLRARLYSRNRELVNNVFSKSGNTCGDNQIDKDEVFKTKIFNKFK